MEGDGKQRRPERVGKISAWVWAKETEEGPRSFVTASGCHRELGGWRRSRCLTPHEVQIVSDALAEAYGQIWAGAPDLEEEEQETAMEEDLGDILRLTEE